MVERTIRGILNVLLDFGCPLWFFLEEDGTPDGGWQRTATLLRSSPVEWMAALLRLLPVEWIRVV